MAIAEDMPMIKNIKNRVCMKILRIIYNSEVYNSSAESLKAMKVFLSPVIIRVLWIWLFIFFSAMTNFHTKMKKE